jgi:tetratricopeptide (TPR) repeat protein
MQEMKKLMTDKNINWKPIKSIKIFFMLTAFLLLGFMHVYAQDLPKDVLEKYQYGNSLEKYNVIKSYLNTFNKNENILIKQSLELIEYFKKQNDYTGVDCGNVFLAFRAYDKHDYTTALNIALPTFSSFKTRNDTAGILMITRVIDYSYYATKNYAEAVKYMKELIPIYIARKNKQGLNFIYNEIGSVYGQAFQPDSGLIFAQQSLNLAYELNNNNLITSSLATIAENYIAKGDYDLAMPFLKKATKQYMIT